MGVQAASAMDPLAYARGAGGEKCGSGYGALLFQRFDSERRASDAGIGSYAYGSPLCAPLAVRFFSALG